MIKKTVLFMVVVVVFLGILYSMGFLDDIVERFTETKVSLVVENMIDMDTQKGDIIMTGEGYYILYDNVMETYDYKGQMADITEFDEFIEKAYFGIRKIVKTSDCLSIEMDGGFSELEFDNESRNLLNISQDERIFVISSDLDETTNTVDIYNDTMKFMGSYDSNRMRVIKTMDSDNSDGVIITTFSYEGSYMTSKIGEYLVEGMYNLWELELNNELVVFQYTAKDGIYVATNKNLYKINNEGSILWTYSGYDYIKDCKFTGDKIILLTGRDENAITTINSEGKVESIVKTEDLYSRLDIYMSQVFISNSSFISTIADGKVAMVYNSDGVIKDLKLDGSKMRLLTENSIVVLDIKID
ncbi:hypothetical protein SAMN02745751_00148 [Dethiosulfatibacter aminovorans DSM 17477]|uniref:Uncharacterized protein n=1 Tax=Dethiosulfatibacter aminovorans DSM 17477 TaxID=1121476 RepID=A0A1M6AJY1_9FIRM|nr:hypothetical protein [Dethiosulfatibacter aminovorans]SHI36782.1 hypothetical protein SAMN02745751_00148 [Dethiosulfatibacter aminovorans DSM 17477]